MTIHPGHSSRQLILVGVNQAEVNKMGVSQT